MPDKPILLPTEREIWRLVAAGDSNAAIAARLEMAESTLRAKLGIIYRLLGASNRAEAARLWGERNGRAGE